MNVLINCLFKILRRDPDEVRKIRTHRVLKIQRLAVAQHAAGDVVLLRGHEGLAAVGRQGHGPQVVGQPRALGLAVGDLAVGEHDLLRDLHGDGIHHVHLTTARADIDLGRGKAAQADPAQSSSRHPCAPRSARCPGGAVRSA